MKTSFSTMAGGGVRGKADGTARGNIIQAGATIEAFHLFMEGYHQVGGMTIGIIIGKGTNGIINEYPTNKSKRIGATGKRADIGRGITIGVSKV